MEPAAELRSINFIKKEQFPYTGPTWLEYDSGDYRPAMEPALEALTIKGAGPKQLNGRRFKRGRHSENQRMACPSLPRMVVLSCQKLRHPGMGMFDKL